MNRHIGYAGIVIVSWLLSGCATLERHPIATAVVSGIIIRSLVAHDGRAADQPVRGGDYPPVCRTNPSSCQ